MTQWCAEYLEHYILKSPILCSGILCFLWLYALRVKSKPNAHESNVIFYCILFLPTFVFLGPKVCLKPRMCSANFYVLVLLFKCLWILPVSGVTWSPACPTYFKLHLGHSSLNYTSWALIPVKVDDEVLTLIDNGCIDSAAFYKMWVHSVFKFLVPCMLSW